VQRYRHDLRRLVRHLPPHRPLPQLHRLPALRLVQPHRLLLLRLRHLLRRLVHRLRLLDHHRRRDRH